MSLLTDVAGNARAFAEVATNLMGVVEANLLALLRIRDKVRLEREIRHIDALLSIFPEIMFVNGVFITEFSREYVLSVESADGLARTRDKPVLADFQKTSQRWAARFDKQAPQVHGLGAEMVVLFLQGIELRRQLLQRYHSDEWTAPSDDVVRAIRAEMAKLYPLERRLQDLRRELKGDRSTDA